MSHIVTIKTEVRDLAAIRAACDRLGLAAPVHGRHEMYQGLAEGHAVKLQGWKYPVVCDLASGKVEYDNFGGRWGEQAKLDSFLQAYAVEKAKIEARKAGHSVTESVQADGSVKLTIEGGAL